MTTACRRAAILATVVLAFANSAQAVTRHVPAEYATIQGAMDAAVLGDSVLVAPGTYTNCDGGPCLRRVVVMKGGVTLLSEGGPDITTVRVDTSGWVEGSVVWCAEVVGGATLRGFRITATAPGYCGAFFRGSPDIVVADCRFEDLAPGPPFQLGAGLIFDTCRDTTVQDCEF